MVKPLRVYLSSTYEDLKEYRAAVFAALEKAGLDVARMEAYAAADERPLDVCLRDVAESDIYVGLYAWRYGYTPPAEHGNPKSKSITELEYRHAEERKLRKLLFLAHSDTHASWPDRLKDDEKSEQGKKLAAFRGELCTEKTASFFRTPDELATLVLAAIMRSGLIERPYNVPIQLLGFVPRVDLTQALVDALLGQGINAAGANTLVQGGGGFGKTALVIDVCHRAEIVKTFPDGIFWIVLGEKPDLSAKLGDLHILATGKSPVVAGIDAIGQVVAKALEGRRCIVVIDDAWRSEDLMPFLGLRSPRLLITTRIENLLEQAGQSGWAEIVVDEMQANESAALLGRGLPLDEGNMPTLLELADRLGCWPLLLELVNARLLEEQKARRGKLADCIDYVTKLFEHRGVLGFDRRNSSERNAAVQRSVGVSLEFAEESFPGLARKAADISVFPEDVSISVIVLAELWKIDEVAVEEDAVRPLANLSLLRWNRQDREVALHDMIHRALQARLNDPAAVHRRLIDSWNDPYRLPHDYAWRWFGWHCARANEKHLLQKLLFDFEWLRQKLNHTDVSSLMAEFSLLPPEPDLQELQDSIRRSAHVIAADKKQLPSQLVGRLLDTASSSVRTVVLGANAFSGDAWLRPLTRSLAPSGGVLLLTISGHTAPVGAVAFTPDDRFAVSGCYANGRSKDHSIRIWDVSTGTLIRVIEDCGEQTLLTVMSAPDGLRIAGVSADGFMRWWSLRSGDLLEDRRLAHEDIKAVTHDGRLAMSASEEGSIIVWSLVDGETVRVLSGHSKKVTAIAISRDGQYLLSASSHLVVHEPELKLWDWAKGEVVGSLKGPRQGCQALALLPGARRALVAPMWEESYVPVYDRVLKLWDLETDREIIPLVGHQYWVNAVAVTSDGRLGISASLDHELKVWDLTREYTANPPQTHPHEIRAVAVTPDGRHALSACGNIYRPAQLRIWDLDTLTPVASFAAHERGITAIGVSPDGRNAATASFDAKVKIWDLKEGKLLHTLPNHSTYVNAVTFSADGRRVISADGWGGAGDLNVWNRRGRKPLIQTVTENLFDLVALPDNKHVIGAGFNGGVLLFSLTNIQSPSLPVVLLTHHKGRVNAVAVTRDGRCVVSGSSDGTLRIRDITACENRYLLLKAEFPYRTPHNLELAVIKLESLEGGVSDTRWHSGSVNSVTLSANDRLIVSASEDHTVKVWDYSTGSLLTTFTADSPIRACAISSSGIVVAGDEFGTLHFLRWVPKSGTLVHGE